MPLEERGLVSCGLSFCIIHENNPFESFRIAVYALTPSLSGIRLK
jgi:hypothetical protein